jgi:hypothetical protein
VFNPPSNAHKNAGNSAGKATVNSQYSSVTKPYPRPAWLILRKVLVVVSFGIARAALGSLSVTRVLKGLLFNSSAQVALIPAVIAVVFLLATIDPALTLRAEWAFRRYAEK